MSFLLSVMSEVDAEVLKSELKEIKGISKRAIDKLFKSCGATAVAQYRTSGDRNL